jgi:hypothetical protein
VTLASVTDLVSELLVQERQPRVICYRTVGFSSWIQGWFFHQFWRQAMRGKPEFVRQRVKEWLNGGKDQIPDELRML